MEKKLLDQIIKKFTGSIEEIITADTYDKSEILISSRGYKHLLSFGTLLCLQELVATTLYYYEHSNITEEDIDNINFVLMMEQGDGFSAYQEENQEKLIAGKRMKRGRKTKIYVIRDSNSSSIKVGKSINPKSRLRGHQTSNPNKLELICEFNGYERDEKIIHSKLKVAGFHIHGEWFKDCKESLDIVRKHFEE